LREHILRTAAERAAKKHGPQFASITYVGDGVWDVRAARELGWRFIGIAAGEQAERLREAGAGLIVPNYCPVEAFLALLLGDD
jgi:phosphoglycolate phosphatase-like HAD superfamily hydrolase